MNIVTIMNYDWKNKKNIELCSIWIKQAKIWLTKFDTVFIYAQNAIDKSLINLINSSPNTCSFRVVIRPKLVTETNIKFGVDHILPLSNHNFLFKLYATTNISFPYLFLDADAIIVNSLQDLEEIFETTINSVFFIDHENNIPSETDFLPPFINSGVFIMNDPEHYIYNWRQIFEFAYMKNFVCRFNNSITIIPGTDQAVLKSYFDYIGYDYHHKKFNIEYNTYSAMINKWFRDKDGRWQNTLKNHPSQICKIIHYWGKYKPWTRDCPLVQEIKK